MKAPEITKIEFKVPTIEPTAETDGKVNIVVVSCGRPQTLRACLRSIEQNTTDIPYYVAIVNNTYPHWKEAMQRYYDAWLERHSDWRLVEGTDNYILKSKNIGISTRPNAKHHILLDDDTIVTKEWLSRMVQGLEDHPEFGIVVPLLNFVPGYFWPSQVAWIPEWMSNSLFHNNFQSEASLQKMWDFYEQNLLPEENMFRVVRTFEFTCVLQRCGWLYDENCGARCGFAGNHDLAFRLEKENLKVAVCRSVIVLHCIRGSLAWDPRFGEDIPSEYYEKKWGKDKTKGIPGPTGGDNKSFARKNMLKEVPLD